MKTVIKPTKLQVIEGGNNPYLELNPLLVLADLVDLRRYNEKDFSAIRGIKTILPSKERFATYDLLIGEYFQTDDQEVYPIRLFNKVSDRQMFKKILEDHFLNNIERFLIRLDEGSVPKLFQLPSRSLGIKGEEYKLTNLDLLSHSLTEKSKRRILDYL